MLLKHSDITWAQTPLELMKGSVVFDAILEAEISLAVKHTMIDWFFDNRKIDLEQKTLAHSRAQYLDDQRRAREWGSDE